MEFHFYCIFDDQPKVRDDEMRRISDHQINAKNEKLRDIISSGETATTEEK